MWTKETALPVIIEAYNAKTLSAQNGATECLYGGPQGPCVIGVLMTEEQRKEFDNQPYNQYMKPEETKLCSLNVRTMFSRGLTKDFLDSKDQHWFAELQQAHDAWIGARNSNANHKLAAENRFRRVVGLFELVA